MCGQFRLGGKINIIKDIEKATGLDITEAAESRYLAAAGEFLFLPFHDVPVLFTDRDGAVKTRKMYWQLIYSWSEEFKSKYTAFNIRAESLEKRHNLPLLRFHRCLFPVSGFYEIKKLGGKTVMPKERYEFTFKDRGIIALGGVYSVWTNPAGREEQRLSAAIITVEPNTTVGAVHNRMPFIVPAESCRTWVDPDATDFDSLVDMVVPFESEEMVRTRTD